MERDKRFFPEMVNFFNGLTDIACSVKDYQFAEYVYKTFNCQNLYKFTVLFNHTGILLLAEIMMLYKRVIQDHFQMDKITFKVFQDYHLILC